MRQRDSLIGARVRAWRQLAVWLAATSIAIAGCGQPGNPAPPPVEQSASNVTPASSVAAPLPSASTTAAVEPAPALVESFTALDQQVSAAVGIAVSDGTHTQVFGSELSGPAWSTIKAPLAIAAFDAFGDQALDSAALAIRQSDNAAAEDLWSMLGSGTTAANAVDAVLRQGGDIATVVQSERVRAGFTPFGQTDWSTRAQAQFAARMSCVAGAQPVLELMRELGGGQQWGLAGGDGVAAKGGWGPDADGMYLVRQLAAIGDERDTLGVALIARPNDGSYESGVAAINQLAAWVTEHRAELPHAPC